MEFNGRVAIISTFCYLFLAPFVFLLWVNGHLSGRFWTKLVHYLIVQWLQDLITSIIYGVKTTNLCAQDSVFILLCFCSVEPIHPFLSWKWFAERKSWFWTIMVGYRVSHFWPLFTVQHSVFGRFNFTTATALKEMVRNTVTTLISIRLCIW